MTSDAAEGFTQVEDNESNDDAFRPPNTESDLNTGDPWKDAVHILYHGREEQWSYHHT
jgi:hypothetical protein